MDTGRSCHPFTHISLKITLLFAALSLGRRSAVSAFRTNSIVLPFHSGQAHSLTASQRLVASSTTRLLATMKRAKLDSTPSSKVIGTHSGTFQADEAMGVFMLRQCPEYRNSKVVRSRDAKVLDPLDIVIDVGGVYDDGKLRYDHHQRDYNEKFTPKQVLSSSTGETVMKERCTKLSASGLVYRHYGKQVIKAHYPTLSDSDVDLVYTKLYNSLLEALDAIDTGVEQAPDGTELVYKDSTGLASRVGRLNPRWNEVDDNGEKPSHDERFERAVTLCGEDFMAGLTVIVESDLPARAYVERALAKRHETDPSGEILCLDSGGLPWRSHLYELEKLQSIEKLIKFVLYTDVSGMWRVQAVTVEGQGFSNRLSLPQEWRGVRDEDLEKLTGIEGCRFVHAAGFIGGANTYEGVLAMARAALAK